MLQKCWKRGKYEVLLFVDCKYILGRIKSELAAAMAGLGTTHSESDVNLMTREHTHSREVM